MKTQITVVAGFLEAGKTTFISRLLSDKDYSDGRSTVLVLCEQGMEEYDAALLKRLHITVMEVETQEGLNERFFEEIDEKYYPDRILIEYNGTWKLGDLLKLRLPRGVSISSILCIADASTFAMYMGNMSGLLSEQLANCDAVLLNRYGDLDKEYLHAVRYSLKNLNRSARIVFYKRFPPAKTLRAVLEEQTPLHRVARAASLIMPLVLLYLVLRLMQNPDLGPQFAVVQTFMTVFLSILIQAVPFLLIGVFVSSILQVFIPDAYLADLFSRCTWLGFPVAIGLGICFPVCDCAMAPIAARLIRKGAPLQYVVTFLLAAPAVNPIVIASTYYAFPNQPRILLLRILFGVAIAVVAGLALGYMFKGVVPVQKTFLETACASGYIGDLSNAGTRGKLEAVLRHAGMEFFNIGRFVVAGAFISSVFQMAIPKSALDSMARNPLLPLLAMLAAAFLMSVCSTSNAFIGRSFSYSFPMNTVLAFMVMGPMLDIKNLLMLSGGFRRKFVGVMVVLLVTIGLFVFSLASIWI